MCASVDISPQVHQIIADGEGDILELDELDLKIHVLGSDSVANLRRNGVQENNTNASSARSGKEPPRSDPSPVRKVDIVTS